VVGGSKVASHREGGLEGLIVVEFGSVVEGDGLEVADVLFKNLDYGGVQLEGGS